MDSDMATIATMDADVAGDMSGTMTAHWLAGQFLNWASQLGHFFDPLSNQTPPNRPIKN